MASPPAEYDHLMKIVFIGDSAVGKSSMLVRFTERQFDPNLAATIGPAGVDFKVHVVENKNKLKVNLSIWDTAGQEKFHSLTASYYRGAHGIFIVYDVTSRASFDHLVLWLEEIVIYATNPRIVKCLIGDKIDLPNRQVTTREGRAFADQHGMLFLECSSKDDVHVNDAFETLMNAILDDPELANETRPEQMRQRKAQQQRLESAALNPANPGTSTCFC